MSASPATTRVVAVTPAMSFEKSKSCFIASPIFANRRGQSSGRGARLAYSWYMGVCFIASAAAGPTCPCCARISG